MCHRNHSCPRLTECFIQKGRLHSDIFLTFIAIVLPEMMSCSGMVYPINASSMKAVLKVPSWIVEIDRDLNNTLNSFPFFPSSVETAHRIKVTLQSKWALCAITSVQSLEKQKVCARCKMILLSWESHRPAVLDGNYTVAAPKAYGVNFTVTKFQTEYLGE